MLKFDNGGAGDIATSSQLNLRLLLANLKRACGLWFLAERSLQRNGDSEDNNDSSYAYILSTVLEIVRHGMRCVADRKSAVADDDAKTDFLQKLSDDFEWVRRSAQIRDSLADTGDASLGPGAVATAATIAASRSQSIEHFLRTWLRRNLRANCLCACLQILAADRELLESYYESSAFLRSEPYSTALFICLSAVELNQYSLLSQIETELYSPRLMVTGPDDARGNSGASKHRRTNSHPIFSISPPKRPSAQSGQSEPNDREKIKQKTPEVNGVKSCTKPRGINLTELSTFRKTKSLPLLHDKADQVVHRDQTTIPRPRSKTMYVSNRLAKESQPRVIPMSAVDSSKFTSLAQAHASVSSPSNTTSSYSGSDDIDMQPSTSANSPTPSHATSNSSVASTTTARRIELIKCDDIKIWTDQSEELKRPPAPNTSTTEPYAIPQNIQPQRYKTKSVSPIGSFLCNLFSTPPPYTHWSTIHQSHSSNNLLQSSDGSTVAVFARNTPTDLQPSSVGVFDPFSKTICGKKLRSRNSQNLFEDGISSLDYSIGSNNAGIKSTEASENPPQTESARPPLPKDHQSLADFLQTSQLSRNNTDLEKENAHFRISEAIISAIEHMKWANADPEKKWRRRKGKMGPGRTPTATATDWLASDQLTNNATKTENESSQDDCSEHIPFAEIGESCLDLLSAEVVGLSLISKFSDKHLPKVSELKWLVSEGETPQQLLPMPDNSPTSNPDENIIPPMTRGTRYWAPPRQQIIFTDHPPPNRRELIKKQNSRCAGCGMRVSPQYVHSFRYCTYLGKYHCTGCHRNQISPIPARILQAWDFKCYPVSVFAYRLLEQMYTYPLFYVPDLNPALYVRIKPLQEARKKRIELKFVKDFIRTCRFAVREQVYFDAIPHHITEDPDNWSLSDFIDVHNKSMTHSIDELIGKCEQHIFSCVLCTARGFLCEYCNKDQVIYPWESKVFRCDRCGVCFHQRCWKSMQEICCRCQRMIKRQDDDDIAEI